MVRLQASLFLFLFGCVTSNLLPLMEEIFRQYRGHTYDEGHVQDTPGKKILREKEYDFIVIGSGSAGSVVANRLSENPDWTVLLLEAGKDEMFFNDIPIFVSYLQLTDYNWGYSTEPQEKACLAMNNRCCNWPRGKSLGGSSSINYMIYTRGHKKDFDNWAQLGNTGWSYDEVLPYFKKSEDLRIPELMGSEYHSSGGYLTIQNITYHTLLGEAFIAAGQELGMSVVDYNGKDQLGVSYIQVAMRKGLRCSNSKAFLRPIRRRRNLHISLNSRVSKIIVDPVTKSATGVEFVKDRLIYRVNARKEVVLCAGALNSPQLLMLSGIGPKEHLDELGIPVIQDLKVGHNLQEHVGFFGTTFLTNDSVGTSEIKAQSLSAAMDYLVNASGILNIPGGVEGVGYIRTKYAEDERPDVELLYATGGMYSDAGGTIRQGIGLTDNMYERIYRSIDNRDGWSIWPIVMRPKSRGVVKLKDKNPLHWPKFYPNFFTDPENHDLKVLIEGIKVALGFVNTSAFQKYGSRLHDTLIPGCEHLSFGSDEYWGCAAKYLTVTLHHQSGTCKMGPPSDPDAVVDPTLRVYGVQGLRVADASIIPLLITAHTNAAATMIGEKVADMIKETWS